ncbi:hypothetical protein C0J52_18254 [Blattella germanica]|nr:hypothetical protein C0J52_18254 [Blattella germanica]
MNVKPGRTTTEDIAEFDSKRVALDIPGEVFGSSFRLVTDLSKIINDVILCIINIVLYLLISSKLGILNDLQLYEF